jgi:general stress protein 26
VKGKLNKESTMSNADTVQTPKGIEKLKQIAEEINICLFCTNLKTDDGATCRPMGLQQVDEHGNLWFFSDVNSDKNKEIQENKHVQLFFAHPGKSSYLVVNGDAEILIDRAKTEELWTPLVKTWFKEGKDDPSLSIIKVASTSAYYWDTEGNKMINFLKMIASVATGTTLLDAKEGTINL